MTTTSRLAALGLAILVLAASCGTEPVDDAATGVVTPTSTAEPQTPPDPTPHPFVARCSEADASEDQESATFEAPSDDSPGIPLSEALATLAADLQAPMSDLVELERIGTSPRYGLVIGGKLLAEGVLDNLRPNGDPIWVVSFVTICPDPSEDGIAS